MNQEASSDYKEIYQDFLLANRKKVNRYMNTVLWCFVLTGPAIALGIKKNIFLDITYLTCILISTIMVVLSATHLFLYKNFPEKTFTCVFALTALDALLLYMSYSHVSIYLTWFLVPLLSLLFCSKNIYLYALGLNYIVMTSVTWLNSAYEAAKKNYDSAFAYFMDKISGFTIETIIMLLSGFIIGKLTLEYFKKLFAQYELIQTQEKAMEEKLGLLNSIAEIYDNVNLIDFVDSTEMSIRDSEQKKHGIDLNNQTHTLVNQKIKNQVMADQLEDFLTFTNIKTVRARLSHKKIISADFIDVVSGWFRAQYITVDSTLDGIPNIVLYTTRNVDEEKRREEHLIRISMTDEMTRLFNRRCYDEDLKQYRGISLAPDFVLFSIDVNGLKTVNDTKGHAAGDELIKGAANCLSLSIGNKGKVYRTGGDEFMAIVHTDNPDAIKDAIKSKTKEWHGVYTDKMTMSVGFAAIKDNPNASIDNLEHLADYNMYYEKEKFYKKRAAKKIAGTNTNAN